LVPLLTTEKGGAQKKGEKGKRSRAWPLASRGPCGHSMDGLGGPGGKGEGQKRGGRGEEHRFHSLTRTGFVLEREEGNWKEKGEKRKRERRRKARIPETIIDYSSTLATRCFRRRGGRTKELIFLPSKEGGRRGNDLAITPHSLMCWPKDGGEAKEKRKKKRGKWADYNCLLHITRGWAGLTKTKEKRNNRGLHLLSLAIAERGKVRKRKKGRKKKKNEGGREKRRDVECPLHLHPRLYPTGPREGEGN